MNPLLQKLQPYPFEKLRALFKGVTPRSDLAPISFGIGEPKHATPALIREAVVNAMSGLASYPATAGSEPLRQAIANWTKERYGLPAVAGYDARPDIAFTTVSRISAGVACFGSPIPKLIGAKSARGVTPLNSARNFSNGYG